MWKRVSLRKRLTRREKQKRKLRMLRSAGTVHVFPTLDEITEKFLAAKLAARSTRRILSESIGAEAVTA